MRLLVGYAVSRWRSLAVATLLSLLAAAAGLAQPLAAQTVVANIGGQGSLARPLLLLVVFVIIAAVLNGVSTWYLEKIAEGLVLSVRADLAHRLPRLTVATLDRRQPGDLIARVTADGTLLRASMTSGIVNLITGALSLIGAITLMAMLSLRLLLTTFVVLLLVAVLVTVILPRIREAIGKSQEAVGLIASELDRVLGAVRTVKISGTEETESRRVVSAAREVFHNGMRRARYTAILRSGTELLGQLSFLAVLGVGGALVASGDIDVATLIAFLLYVFYLNAPINLLNSAVTSLQQGMAAATRIEEVKSLPLEDDLDPAANGTPPAANPSARDEDRKEPPVVTAGTANSDHRHNGSMSASGITVDDPPKVDIRDVSFGYEENLPVLQNVSFAVPAGAHVAIVGPSGSGKTTLFSLLARFYDADSGRIYLDGRDIASQSRALIRQKIALVEQDSPIMAGTLRENICYAAPDVSEARIREVLDSTRLTEFVAHLPRGLDTDVGPRGVALSGGERQRIAIARALLRNPELLLLDEATSQLDGRNEAALIDTIRAVTAHCTVLMIAHRMSTIVSAHQIVLLESGKVRAIGRHSELLEKDALYAELATAGPAAERFGLAAPSS